MIISFTNIKHCSVISSVTWKKEENRASADLRAEVEWKATQRSRVLVVQGPFANFVRLYIMVGEYLFPIAFGAIASVMLYLTQKVAMLWELTPRWVE